jgi:AcrR family transcriptional regulator
LLTAKGLETRQRIVAGAANEARARGVDAIRLEDVMARTKISKSQLFHYFPHGKEELLLAIAQHAADQVLADQQPMLGMLTTWPAWFAWRDALIARYRNQGMFCPLNGLLGQTGKRAPAAQAVVTDLMQRWQTSIADGIRHMQSTGDIPAEVDAERSSAALLAGIQGGVLLMLATSNLYHLEAAVDLGIAGLRLSAHPPSAAGGQVLVDYSADSAW